MNNSIRFSSGRSVFRCPVCQEPLICQNTSLLCSNGHSFDISKHGYVNLAGGTKGSAEHYDKDSFKKRQQILEAGYYSHICQELIQIVDQLPKVVTVLDCGCGEGYYSRALDQLLPEKQLIAFDISRDSIQLASKSDLGGVQWFVGDSTNLPIRSHSINCILDIFAPANYAEFRRVLSRTGYVIKVIPGNGHLKEFRQLAKEHLRKETYSNQSVMDYFEKHFELLDRRLVSKTFEMPLSDREIFADMTPLLFHIDRGEIDLTKTNTLTIEGEILIGRPLDWNDSSKSSKGKSKSKASKADSKPKASKADSKPKASKNRTKPDASNGNGKDKTTPKNPQAPKVKPKPKPPKA